MQNQNQEVNQTNAQQQESVEQLEITFSEGNGVVLVHPKMEGANIPTDAYNRTVYLIASCLDKVIKDGKTQSCEDCNILQKMQIVNSMPYGNMRLITEKLPAFLGEFYLKAKIEWQSK